MNVTCVDCKRQWQIGCPECADHHADYHRESTGHTNIHVTGVDDTKRGAIVDLPAHPFPQWMRGSSV